MLHDFTIDTAWHKYVNYNEIDRDSKGFPPKNEFLVYNSHQKETNQIWPISYENLYPYVHFEYEYFSEWLREAKILIPRCSIPESKC